MKIKGCESYKFDHDKQYSHSCHVQRKEMKHKFHHWSELLRLTMGKYSFMVHLQYNLGEVSPEYIM